MRILDRYLLRQFVANFVICFVSLAGLYVIFDAFTNFEEFLRGAEKHGGLLSLLGSYYGYKSIEFFDRASPLLVLVAAMFTVTWIQRYNELLALMAAGISRVRVVAPVIVAAVTITLLAALNRELVIPRISDELTRTPQDFVGDVARPLRPRYDNQTNILVGGESVFRQQGRISKPDILLPSSLDDYGKTLLAADAIYQPPQGNRPGGFLLRGVKKPDDLAAQPSLPVGGPPVLVTPRDAPDWLKPDQCFVVTQMNFDDLTGPGKWQQYASTPALIADLRNPSYEFGANVRVTIHSRFVQPLLDVTLLFLGLPLVLTRESRNLFVAIGMCLAVVSAFMVVVMGFHYVGGLGLDWVSPAAAAWAPLMIFVPVAVGASHAMWE